MIIGLQEQQLFVGALEASIQGGAARCLVLGANATANETRFDVSCRFPDGSSSDALEFAGALTTEPQDLFSREFVGRYGAARVVGIPAVKLAPSGDTNEPQGEEAFLPIMWSGGVDVTPPTIWLRGNEITEVLQMSTYEEVPGQGETLFQRVDGERVGEGGRVGSGWGLMTCLLVSVPKPVKLARSTRVAAPPALRRCVYRFHDKFRAFPVCWMLGAR